MPTLRKEHQRLVETMEFWQETAKNKLDEMEVNLYRNWDSRSRTRFDLATYTICNHITTNHPSVPIQPFQKIREAILVWHDEEWNKDIPSQAELNATLRSAIDNLAIAYNVIYAQAIRKEPPPDAANSDKKPPKDSQRFRHGPDYRSCSWNGESYTFTKGQAACVKILWEAWENGTPEVGQDCILVEAELESQQLKDLFKGHAAWGKMIVSGRRGSYRLAEPR